MILATVDFVERLAEAVGQPAVYVERILWSALLLGLIFASIHLVTMLVTRWGDSDPTSKSLIFSVLVHLSCAFGLVAVSPAESKKDAGVDDQKFEIQQLLVEGSERIELDKTGDNPFWEEIAEKPDRDLARVDRPTEIEPLQGPERREQPETPPDTVVPDLTQLPEQPLSKPELQRQAAIGVSVEAAVPMKIEDETAEARPEVSVPSVSMRRRITKHPDGLQKIQVDRDPKRGALERVDEKFDPTKTVASIAGLSSPNARIKRHSDRDTIRRRAGPTPPIVPDDDAGTTSPSTSDGSRNGSAEKPRFSRTKRRAARSVTQGTTRRIRSERTPQTPERTPDRSIELPRGIARGVTSDSATLNIVRPNFDPIRTRKNASLPATYRLRILARRTEIAQKYGGTDDSERAVEASLAWLARHQNIEGFWDADGFTANCPDNDRCLGTAGRKLHGTETRPPAERRAGLHADSGVTALAVLAFLAAAYTHEDGQYADQIDRALSWLIRQQRDDGFLGGEATYYARNYCHAMATYAMAEAYGMQSDPTADTRLRAPLTRATAYIVRIQNSDGGWRYPTGRTGDMSMFGWQLMALKSAEIAGIPYPQKARNLMIKFLKDRSLGQRSGLAAYWIDPKTGQSYPPSASMTAEALFCKQMLGIRRTNSASIEAVEYMMQNTPKRSTQNLYYWYYGTLAMYQYGGEPWRKWNESLRDTLVEDQQTTGHAAGSWDPKAPWGSYGGRVYSTALSTLCLEVYYRFLPLYQLGGQYETERN